MLLDFNIFNPRLEGLENFPVKVLHPFNLFFILFDF